MSTPSLSRAPQRVVDGSAWEAPRCGAAPRAEGTVPEVSVEEGRGSPLPCNLSAGCGGSDVSFKAPARQCVGSGRSPRAWLQLSV